MANSNAKVPADVPIPEIPDGLLEPIRELVRACQLIHWATAMMFAGEDPLDLFDSHADPLCLAKATLDRWRVHLGMSLQDMIDDLQEEYREGSGPGSPCGGAPS